MKDPVKRIFKKLHTGKIYLEIIYPAKVHCLEHIELLKREHRDDFNPREHLTMSGNNVVITKEMLSVSSA